jgi:TatD DNase family protein
VSVPESNPLIDIGANLTHDVFKDDLAEVLARAAAQDVGQMVVTGASLQGSRDAVALAEQHPLQLFATAGIHPHHADEATPEIMAAIRLLAMRPETRAVGETGLDFYRDLSPREVQIAAFERHIELAIETGLPMFLHERDAFPAMAEILRPYRHDLGALVIHCFTGDATALHSYLDMDCYVGITGWICDERRGSHLIPLAKDIPLDRLMIETDAPYLLPRTIQPRVKTRRNEPQYLPFVCRFIAECRQATYGSIAAATTSNARRFFNLTHAR